MRVLSSGGEPIEDLRFFMRSFRVAEEHKQTTREFLLTHFDLGGFSCISTETVRHFAFVGNIALLQSCARTHGWPSFVKRALDPRQDSSYWRFVRLAWPIAAKCRTVSVLMHLKPPRSNEGPIHPHRGFYRQETSA